MSIEDVYRSEPRFLQHLQLQSASAEQYKNETGASPEVIAEIEEDAAVYEWLIETCDLANEFKETAFGIKKRFFSGTPDPPAGQFMIAPGIVPPAAILAGAVGRSRKRDQDFLRFAGITEAAKIAMDLIGDGGTDMPVDQVKPLIKLKPLESEYEFEITVTGKNGAEMVGVQIRRANQEKWETVKFGTGKTIVVKVEPTVDGQIEKFEVRAQLYMKDAPFGQPSDPQYVTVSP